MKITKTFKSVVIDCVCFLYILLFVYAAVNKIIDFNNFQIQLAQSPLLSVFAEWISYLVPATEITIAILLCFQKFKKAALYCGFSLMVMFSTYIIIILNFSPFVPCSCGGVLEKLNWSEHLIFNFFFVLLGIIGVLCFPRKESVPNLKVIQLLITALCSTIVIGILFLLSEDMIHHQNNFIRRFPHHPAVLNEISDLKFDSYYIAGVTDGKIYLGNLTAPLTVTIIDSTLKIRKRHVIKLSPEKTAFYDLRLSLQAPYFYLYDGRVPIIYRGIIGQWNAEVWSEGKAYFNAFEPVNDSIAIFRAVSSTAHEHVLGVIIKGETGSVFLNPILDKQSDGIFDTGGTLRYNAKLKKVIYTYTLKNEYLITDPELSSKSVRNTIDTISHIKMETNFNEVTKERSLSSPVFVVNKMTRTYDDFLFVNSNVVGKFEDDVIWNKSSVIDVYSLKDDSYEFSFYLTHIKDLKMLDFIVAEDKIYIICGNYLASFRLRTDFFKSK